jgi:hypothetical protein
MLLDHGPLRGPTGRRGLIFDDFVTVVRNERIERLWPPAWAWYEQ